MALRAVLWVEGIPRSVGRKIVGVSLKDRERSRKRAWASARASGVSYREPWEAPGRGEEGLGERRMISRSGVKREDWRGKISPGALPSRAW